MNELKEYLSDDDLCNSSVLLLWRQKHLRVCVQMYRKINDKQIWFPIQYFRQKEEKVFKQQTSLFDLLLSRRRNKISFNCFRKRYGIKYWKVALPFRKKGQN
ncbi:hypothetical protein JTB14_009530 [Gonioctena quinquepunctata]|nr:hypothetical protein JTB14_009530 [Gonioctena quinquepunctata]